MKPFLSFCQCFFLLLLLANKGIGQENYSARWYTSDNNELPQSSVKKIVRDKYGFIWMTTEDGLVRYDGSNFQVFNSSAIQLSGYRFSEILGDVEKDSMFCYNEGKRELILIHQRKIQTIRKKPLNNNITRNGKRFLFHDGLPSTKTLEKDASFYIKSSKGANYFVSTDAVEVFDAAMKPQFRVDYKNTSVFNFFILNEQLFYLKENGEYNVFSEGNVLSGKLEGLFLKKNFKLFWDVTSQQVFLYSDSKIYFLKAKHNRLSASLICEFKGFDSSNIMSLFYDEGNKKLYLGSSTNGLCIVSFHSFKAVKRNTQKTDVYYASLPLNNDLLVTSEGLILNPEKVTDSIPLMESRNYNDRITMAKDKNGNIWVVRRLQLLCYLKTSGYKNYLRYDFRQQIKATYKDWNDRLWFSFQKDEFNSGRLFRISEDGSIVPEKVLDLDKNINYIAQYDGTTFYLGTDEGIYKYDLRYRKLFFIENTENITIRSIFIDSTKDIWITTYEKGFYLYKNNVLYTFPKDKNNYLNSSHCIVEDERGFFWISTNKGLFQVSKQALLNYTKDKTRSVYYHHYNKEDGFLTNEFNGGCQPCGNYLQNKHIAFPSMNGMVFFKPNTIHPLLPNKELFIDKVVMDDKVIYPKDTIVLDNNFQRVLFLIDYPYYGNPDNLNIEARLNGTTNSQWEKIGADKSISFTRLAPGKYVLFIRSLSGFDSTYKYKTMTLIVPPLFYQTLWFKILCYVLVIAVLFFLWYMRLYYMKIKNRQLQQTIVEKTRKLAKTIVKLKSARSSLEKEIAQQERLVKSISHDIKSPLKFLAFTVRHLSDNAEVQQDTELKQQVDTIYSSSVQLYEYVENLVKYSTIFMEGKKFEEASYSLYELIEEKVQLFEKIARTENTVLINKVDENTQIKTNKKVLSIIIHNLLDNAVKHTENGTVELQSKTEGNTLFLTVKDTGKGMSQELIDYYLDFSKNPKLKNYHLGLHMIIELLNILDGTINISSKINEGTTIEIIVDYV